MRSAVAWVGAIALAGGGLMVTATNASAAAPTPAPIVAAGRALREHPSAIRSSARDAYAVYSSQRDIAGRAIVRYTRRYAGLRVYGGDVIIRTAADGGYLGSSVGLDRPLALATTPKVSAAAARASAVAAFRGTVTGSGAPELFVDASSRIGRLAYETVISGWAPDGQTPSRLHVITDALTGKVTGSFDEIETIAGTGTGLYSGSVPVQTTPTATGFSLVDPAHGDNTTCDMGNRTGGACTTFMDADNVWGTGKNTDRASAAVDAHFGAAVTFDYYQTVHGRSGIFGDGRGVPSRVHYGSNYVNAFWNGAGMTYGDGDGNAKPLVALDVAGHEMTHGITQNLVPDDLTYAGESGGLNEATSDIFGTMVEFYAHAPSDPGDYELGENIDINGDGKALRFMYNPALDGRSQGCWSTSTDDVDVHYSSGVANHFFFDLAEGTGATAFGTSPICGSAKPVVGIGRDKAAKIWYRALDAYFVSNTSYVDTATPGNTARADTLAAATDLYGYCSTEYKAVRAAWNAVNVPGDELCSDGPDFTLAPATPGVTVSRGGSTTVTVNTTAFNGAPEQVAFTAVGTLPPGVTATFNPPTVTAGKSTTLTLTAGRTASHDNTAVRIVATAPSITRSAALAVAVDSGPGCSGADDTAVAIPDNATLTRTIDLGGCTATPSATSHVDLHITHPYVNDLVVSLLAPDGTGYVVYNGHTDSNVDDIDRLVTVDLSGETTKGTWTLRVQDTDAGETGTLTKWALYL